MDKYLHGAKINVANWVMERLLAMYSNRKLYNFIRLNIAMQGKTIPPSWMSLENYSHLDQINMESWVYATLLLKALLYPQKFRFQLFKTLHVVQCIW